jgi:hypothetical protein
MKKNEPREYLVLKFIINATLRLGPLRIYKSLHLVKSASNINGVRWDHAYRCSIYGRYFVVL